MCGRLGSYLEIAFYAYHGMDCRNTVLALSCHIRVLYDFQLIRLFQLFQSRPMVPVEKVKPYQVQDADAAHTPEVTCK